MARQPRALVLQADWTPWGREDSWAAPWVTSAGLQYMFDRFNGAKRNLTATAGMQ